MQLDSRQHPVYFPDQGQSSVLRLGLQTLDPVQWIHSDADLPLFRRHKLEIGKQLGNRVFQASDASIPAQRELRGILLHHLLKQYPNLYRQENNSLCFQSDPADHFSDVITQGEVHCLWQCSLWVQEDLCIMERSGDEYRLTAASVCSPSNWKLEQKMGKSLDLIHQVVPDYQPQLSARVNRLFDGLKPDKPVLRYNWSIQAGNELCWRDDNDRSGDDNSAKYWRVERQTLRRLPITGAIIFTIRIYLYSFATMAQFPEFTPHLQAILARLPQNQKTYKGL